MEKTTKRLLCLLILMGFVITSVVACTKKGNGDDESASDVESDVLSSESVEETTEGIIDNVSDTLEESEETSEKMTEGSDESETDEGSEVTTETEEITETEGSSDSEKDEDDGIPIPIMQNFDGYQFRVLTRGSGMYQSDDITGDIKGTTLSLATYQRNAALESKYNFVIVETKDKNWNSTAQRIGASGLDEYDMWSFKMADMPSHAQEGYLYDLNELSEMNLDASYYDQTTRAEVSLANYLFFITGDMLYMDDLGVSCVLYHPTLWDTFKCSEVYGKDIYDIVRDGEWTFETFTTLAAIAPADVNGDGLYDDEHDTWGCGYANGDIFTMSIGLGNHVIEKNSDDVFYLNEDAKLISDLEKIFNFFNSSSCIKDGTYLNETHLFQILQLANGAGPTSPIRKAGLDYGIVPPPKADADEGWYHSYVSTYASNCIAIPTSVRNEDKVVNIIELTSYESQTTLVPKFSEYLFLNMTQHGDDIEMVNILKETKTYENAYLWSTGGIYTALIELNQADGAGLSAAFVEAREAVEASVERKLQRIQQLG